jgi:serine/threonine protein kinase
LFSNTMYLIFEYADRGDLKRILDAQRKGKRDIFLNKLKVCYEIASGMEYVSSLNIVHKDLATRNILLDKSYTSKIADFGCCKLEFMAKRPCKKFRNF